jgi:hypothetical protein
MVLRHVASWHWLYLTAKPSHVGVIVDELACPCTILRHVAVRRGHKASCQVLSSPVVTVGSGAFAWDVKPPGLDIGWSVDRMGTCTTASYRE